LQAVWQRIKGSLTLGADDLLRDVVYRRLWISILVSSFGGQITLLALPLTAAVLLNATPTQMGLLTAMEVLPFALFSLPGGVWLDRVRKLPVYIVGELTIGVGVATVPLVWYLGALSMTWLYVVGFLLGCVHTLAGSAAQVVLTQIVPRERLVEAHAKNALASSGAEVMGPGFAGVLIKLVGAPVALLMDAAMVLASAAILRGVRVNEPVPVKRQTNFWQELKVGLNFVASQRLLITLACVVGCWQLLHNAALVVQILFATRELRLSEQTVGLCYVGVGVGAVLGSVFGHRVSARIGPGPSLLWGVAVCAVGWLALAAAPVNHWGVFVFAFMMSCFGVGATFSFINFLSMRQAVTPQPLLGRMTSTMRWLILIPAGPGALLGGWLGEHHGLRSSLWFSGIGGLALAWFAWRFTDLPKVKALPALVVDTPALPQPLP
jgi:MFS family permease